MTLGTNFQVLVVSYMVGYYNPTYTTCRWERPLLLFQNKKTSKKQLMTEFPRWEVDVSKNCCRWIASCPLVHWGVSPYKITLILDADEVVKIEKSLCGEDRSQILYRELGAVGKSKICCFTSLVSDFGTFRPGCGCEEGKIDKLVEELNQRRMERGSPIEGTIVRLDKKDGST